MPDTAPAVQQTTDAQRPNVPAYPYPYQQMPQQEAPPNGLVPSVLRESGGLLKKMNEVSPILLAILALVGMCGVCLYGLIFVMPQMHQDGVSQINRSNEDQRELDRAMWREESERNRRSATSQERGRELRDKAMLDTLAEVKSAVVEVKTAVSKWEKK